MILYASSYRIKLDFIHYKAVYYCSVHAFRVQYGDRENIA